jgi:peptide/nickel transport system permease protein
MTSRVWLSLSRNADQSVAANVALAADQSPGVPPDESLVPDPGAAEPKRLRLVSLLGRDHYAAVAATVLLCVFLVAIFGPLFATHAGQTQHLDLVNTPPFHVKYGVINVLGTDGLGRSVLARVILAARTTMLVAIPTVVLSMSIGSLIGMWAGFHRGRRETISMRIADIIMSFPSLLLAVVVLYIFSPSPHNIVLILTITRIPVYLRTSRAESAEIRSRLFVDAARSFGSKDWAIIRRHVVPIVLPTLCTVATLDFCYVMLAESSLSFLGIGIQPPDVSWGLMVAQGQDYLSTTWWMSFFPGIAIVITALSATILSSWLRIATDPGQRWRLAVRAGRRRETRREDEQ